MALLPTPSTGRLLRWKSDGTLENVTISDLLDSIASATEPSPGTQKYWIDTSLVTGVGAAVSGVSMQVRAGTPTIVVGVSASIDPVTASMAAAGGTPTVAVTSVSSVSVVPAGASMAATAGATAAGVTAALNLAGASMAVTGNGPSISTVTGREVTPAGASMQVMAATAAVSVAAGSGTNAITYPTTGDDVSSATITFTGTTETSNATVELWDTQLVTPLVPANPSFESATSATTEQTGAWWWVGTVVDIGGGSGATGSEARAASSAIAGSYAARLAATNTSDGKGAESNYIATVNYKWTRTDLETAARKIAWKAGLYSGTGKHWVELSVLDSNGHSLIGTAVKFSVLGELDAGSTVGDNALLVTASPSVGTYYSCTIADIKDFITARLAGLHHHKTGYDDYSQWSDVDHVHVAFSFTSSMGGSGVLLVDDFS